MPWFNVDDSFHSHPKVLATEPAALGLWVVAGSWSNASRTEGFVPDHVLPRLLPGSAELARALVTAGLWSRVKGGYMFHDWTDWNLSVEQIDHKRKQAAERQRRFRERKNGAEVTPFVTRDITRDQRVSNGAQSNPDLSLGSVVDHLSRRIAHAYEDDDLVQAIVDSVHNRTGQVIPAAHASVVAAEILEGRNPDNPKAYVQKAIHAEKDPKGRFLPKPGDGAPSRPDWCGQCRESTRRLEDDDGYDAGPCPRCNPKARAS